MDISSQYTDLNGLSQLKVLGKKDEAAALKQVAQQFESLFVRMMMKSMRDANAVFAEGNPLNTEEMKFHQDMLDQQLSLSLSSAKAGSGIGLAEVLERQLSKQYHLGEKGGDPLGTPIQPLRKSIPIQASPRTLKTLSEEKSASQGLPVLENKSVPAEIKPALSTTPTTSAAPTAPLEFNSPEQFVKNLYAHAKSAAEKLGVKAEVLLSQAALETGWGKKIMQHDSGSSHNLFGIKADKRWQGEVVDKASLEYEEGVMKKVVSPFRSYGDFQQSFEDYVAFIKGNPRYQKALQVGSDAKAYTQALQDAGYATDPAYAQKIQRILESGIFSPDTSLPKEGQG